MIGKCICDHKYQDSKKIDEVIEELKNMSKKEFLDRILEHEDGNITKPVLHALYAWERKDKCVNCNEETEYNRSEHIDNRDCYIEGAGQLCRKCFNGIYGL